MSRYEITINGTMPLIMHADILANPLHEKTKAMKRVSGKRTKTDEDHQLMSWLEFDASLYIGTSTNRGEIVVPASNLMKCLIEGARVTKSGPKVERGVSLDGVEFPLVYVGPRDAKGLFADISFVDRRSVKVGTSKVMRTRPIFHQWSVTFQVFANDAVCSKDDLIDIVSNAGALIGLLDFRKAGGFGRFESEVTPIF